MLQPSNATHQCCNATPNNHPCATAAWVKLFMALVKEALVKEALTVCCTHTAARILLSKAAANASGNLLSSLQATLQFASANKIELHQGILQKLHACRDKLAAASSSKQKAAAKS